MKQKGYKLLGLAIVLMMPFIGKAVTVTDTALAANVQTCLKPELLRMQFSISGAGTTGSYLDIKLPTGFSWGGIAYGPIVTGGSGSNTATYAGIVGGKHRITFGTSTASQVIRIGIWQKATCGAGSSSYTALDSLFFFEGAGTINKSASNTFNGSSPDLSLTGITNSPATANVGANITRSMTITNGGNGGTKNFLIIDKFGANNLIVNISSFYINPNGVNYNIPSSYISLSNDSLIVKLDSFLCQQLGDNDQVFENSESFVLRYQFQLISCGNSSNQVNSNLSAIWRCDATNNCVKNTVNTSISVTLPSAPSLSYWGRRDLVQCYNGSSASVDTVRVINTGGTVRNLLLNVGNSRSNTFQNSTNRIDTSALYFRIGKNGVKTKIKALSGVQFTDCKGVSGYSRINLDTLDILATNDTVWVFIPRTTNVCNFGCVTDSRVTYTILSTGLGLVGTYSNGCANLNFTITQRELFASHDYGANIVYTGGNSLSCGGKLTLQYAGTAAWWFVTTTSNRVHNDFEIQLPSDFLLDTISGVTAYIRNNGVNYYPIARPTSNTFRFNNPVTSMASATLFIHIKGTNTNGLMCAGPATVSLNSKLNPDTAQSCNSSFQNWCLQTNVQWYPCASCCSEGLEVKSMEAYRKNLDIKDALNNGVASAGKPDSTLVQRKAYIIGDTMVVISKVVAKTSLTNPLFEYAYFKTGLAGGTTNWEHLQTTVKHWGPLSSLSTINPSPVFTGDSVRWDLSALPDILNQDTITIQSYFKVKYLNFTNTSLSSSNATRWYTSRVANPTIAQQIGILCGKTSFNTSLIGYLVSTGGSTNAAVTGCSQVQVNGGIRYTTENQPWPYELRPSAYPSRIAYKVPTGWAVDSVLIPSSVASGKAYSTIWSYPYNVVGDSVIFNVGTLFIPNGGSIGAFADREEFYYRINIKPTCKAPSALTNSGSTYSYTNIRDAAANRKFSVSRSNLQASMAQFVVSSTNPVAQSYATDIIWPITITNATAITAPNSFIYLRSANGLITIDSVYSGSTKATAVNGFYQLGTIAGNGIKSLTVYAKSNACSLDSLEVHAGFDCSAYPTLFTNNICGIPSKLYVQPQLASIQTSTTSLSSTPRDPSNASSTAYGISTISMCGSFPVEMEIQSTQAGNIYNIKEVINLPIGTNSNTALDYVSDSGYIEYPIGTAPRRFSAAANTAILAAVSSGKITLDINQIDPDSFSTTKGLKGTGLGTTATRRIKLRFKMRPNCDLISGDNWTATQKANTPCGANAAGNNGTVGGFAINITGVSRPYLADVAVSTSKIEGCTNTTAVKLRLEKVGSSAPSITDSIILRLPKSVAAGTINCGGAFCPSGTVVPVKSNIGNFQYLKWRYPSTAGTAGDTLLYTFTMGAADKATCTSGEEVKIDVIQKITITCGAGTCPNASVSLGGDTKPFDIEKAILGFTGYSSTYVYPSFYKYRFSGNVSNTSTTLAAPTGVTLKTFMDINNNLTYEKNIDSLVKTTIIGTSIAANGAASFTDSFENYRYSPSPNLPLYTVIDTGDAAANCFCGGVVQSAFNQALPIEFLSVGATNINNLTGKVKWQTNADIATQYFNIYRITNNDAGFKKIGTVLNKGISAINNFTYYDPINSLANGIILYQIEAISINNVSKLSSIVNIEKTNIFPVNTVFKMQPNPANANVNIVLNEGLANGAIKIIDINGKVVYTQNFEGLTTNINTSQLAAGIYSVQVTSNEGVEIQKLSIVR